MMLKRKGPQQTSSKGEISGFFTRGFLGTSIYVSRNEFLIKPSRLETKHSRAKAYECEDHLLSPNFEERLVLRLVNFLLVHLPLIRFFSLRTDLLFYFSNKTH
ncbi:hypothetical protein TNIN_194971 [Trichonephila inaurata madagascariensis]|uniref:Uncharacterized protein n=1 Tax=Trichonephila inaurata madagascariensis TaxID=2747483 RepID=A0A8X7C7R5_9ARAC|nr:hypothetical protein TNIN_194971 [Trichonephila inaurata madagascariensis]